MKIRICTVSLTKIKLFLDLSLLIWYLFDAAYFKRNTLKKKERKKNGWKDLRKNIELDNDL